MPKRNLEDKFHEECGVFGVYNHNDASAMVALGLHALQHRGQEAAGIVSFDGNNFHNHRAIGLVGDNFSSEKVIKRLPGDSAIGHNRYSTTGETVMRNIQPLYADLVSGGFSVAHNGNLTNALKLRKNLIEKGCLFHSTTDTEVIIHLTAKSKAKRPIDRITDALRQIEGAYSLVAMTSDSLIGVRDPNGVRPLVLGKIDDSFVLASETCAFDIIGADYVRAIEPGELVVINKTGLQSYKPFGERNSHFCIFEYIYFARPDSIVEDVNVYESRKKIGAMLAKENPVKADLVVPIPDSGVPAALGYSEKSKIPFDLGIIRNHYVGRTFIEPTDQIRHLGVRLKHNANKLKIKNKRVILVDDSIVRGTTSKKIVEMVRDAGAKEVHMRIASPPTAHPCFYGIDTPKRKELLAAKMSVKEMEKFLSVDSLAFISMDGIYKAMGEKKRDGKTPQFCDACFTGEYPIPTIDHDDGKTDSQLSLLVRLA
ncbi:MAG: amidophosphoribosyltransferase [Rickettsiales bacterium]|nr:amidophosphoribosyltransferase [Rickettsiales bacterium]